MTDTPEVENRNDLIPVHHPDLENSNTHLSRGFMQSGGKDRGWVEGHREEQSLPADVEKQGPVAPKGKPDSAN